MIRLADPKPDPGEATPRGTVATALELEWPARNGSTVNPKAPRAQRSINIRRARGSKDRIGSRIGERVTE